MMIYTRTSNIFDEKNKISSRWFCCRNERWLCMTLCRSIFIFIFPILFYCFFFLNIISFNHNDSSSKQYRSILLGWVVIGIIGWIGERIRIRRVRERRFTRVPFVTTLITVYSVQSLLLMFMYLWIPNNDTLNAASILKQESYNIVQNKLILNKSDQLRGRANDGLHKHLRHNVGEYLTRFIRSTFKPVLNDKIKKVFPNENKSSIYLTPETVSTMTPEDIVKMHLKFYQNGILSVILASHNEHEYMTRTLESLFNSTHPGLLREIIIVDDFSQPPLTDSLNSSLYCAPLVRMIVHTRREGLIRSKTTGADAALGSIIVFLDAHVKPDWGWGIPIVRHINTNYKRVVVPKIPILNGTTWEINRNAVGEKMMFDWEMGFNWIYNSDNLVPCMSGGLLAISKQWWIESGKLDTGMFMWGGENIEQSLRIWLCGGEIIVAKDSIIGHVFRPKFPYTLNSTLVFFNKLRAIETWFDDYKDFYYNSSKSQLATKFRPPIPLPVSGEGSVVDPVIEQMEPFKNITERLEIRERLHCQPFQWYVTKFEDIFKAKKMLPIHAFMIMHPFTNTCLSVFPETTSGISMGLKHCNQTDYSQYWDYRFNHSSIINLSVEKCMDATTGKFPSNWINLIKMHTYQGQEASPTLKHRPEVYSCDIHNVNQKGWSFTNNHLTYASFCMEISQSLVSSPPLFSNATNHSVFEVYLTSCRHWNEENPIKSLQYFDLRHHRLISIKELQQNKLDIA